MILRSYHRLSKTTDGHEAWRGQSLPALHRQVLARLREPMTVHDLMEKLSNFELVDITESIGALASKGWVLVEEPIKEIPEESLGGTDDPVTPLDALQDLMSRRPLPVPSSAPVDNSNDSKVSVDSNIGGSQSSSLAETKAVAAPVESVPVDVGAVFDRGTAEQERALLIAMGLLGQDAPYHGVLPSNGFDKIEDVADEGEPLGLVSVNAEKPSAPVSPAPPPRAPKVEDPRREAMLARMHAASNDRRETKQALRAQKARLAEEQAKADETSRRNREAEEAERNRRKK